LDFGFWILDWGVEVEVEVEAGFWVFGMGLRWIRILLDLRKMRNLKVIQGWFRSCLRKVTGMEQELGVE
jgi:hypothetical protein